MKKKKNKNRFFSNILKKLKQKLFIKKRGRTKKKKNKNLKYIVASLFLIFLTIFLLWFYKNILIGLPNVNRIYDPPNLSTKIYDKDGKVLYRFYIDENRSWKTLDKIPKNFVNATLAIEDKHFYKHFGVSIKSILSAFLYNQRNKGTAVRGGSTITQQLVKNVFFDRSRTWTRKVKEAILAIEIEMKLTKDEILERYFNQVAYGGEAYGAQEASIKYFGKNIEELDLAESAFLAGLPAAPSSYSPISGNINLGYERQRMVLNNMVELKMINEEEKNNALKEELIFKKGNENLLAPHFVFYVKTLIEKKYGFSDIGRLGLNIYTTLDYDIQKKAEEIVKDEISKVKRLHITNGSALIIDVKNGGILAMVGSKDYGATDIDGKVNVTTSLRQPGSSIKPINYLLSLMNGKTLLSTIDDSPITYHIQGQEPYSPKNYTGKYLGHVTLKTALASSLNIPSVKLLAESGVDKMIDLGEKMGITTWTDRKRFGLSLALGGGEVKMVDLAQAYSIFANMGTKIEIDPVLKIDNYLGESLFEKNILKEKIIDEEYAFLINTTLSDDYARSPIFGLNSKLKIPNKTVAVKTGTTNSLKDNWCVGWTPSYLVAVWVGNNDSTPMSYVASGISGATPIWNRIIHQLVDDKQDEIWNVPKNITKEKACGKEDYFINGTQKMVKCPTRAPTQIISPTN